MYSKPFWRRGLFVPTFAAIVVFLVACGDDGDTGASSSPGGSAGAGGTGNTAGKAGTAGIAGSAGKGGAAGKGGSSGSAGASGKAGSAGDAGKAGSGGASGSAGSGGSVGGEGGSAGSAGSAGDAGSAGTGGAAGEAGSAGAAGAAGSGPSCDTGLTACGESCVDLQSDPLHCGVCDKACAENEACMGASCLAVCKIEGQTFKGDDTNPANACQVCTPALSTTAWTPRADGTSCDGAKVCAGGSCEARCFIDGALQDAAAVNPANPCEACDPEASTTGWTASADGTACAQGACVTGACKPGCFLEGTFYEPQALNPANPCEACDPAGSTTAWTARASGSGCGAGEVCEAGSCQAGCSIGGKFRAPASLDPDNPCEACDPAVSADGWTPLADGSTCGAGVCQAGACGAECFIGGKFYSAQAANPANACEQCQPAASATSWTARSDGSACGAGKVCQASSCQAKCFIGGVVYAAGAANPANGCQACTPASSTTSWSERADGATCGAGKVCQAKACVAKCFIGNAFYASGDVNPANICEQCSPSSSTTKWTPRAEAPVLVGGVDVSQQGWEVVSIDPSTLTYGPGYTRLATTTNSGANSGGALLLRKAGLVASGKPFSLRFEVLVESVTNHNQLDCASALLGSLTGSVGSPTDRSQMICIDNGAVVWSDDSQSSAVNLLNNGYHSIVLSVTATGSASVSVDGVPRLTRNGFTTNGIIAVGDQTNDAKVDGVTRIKAITKICP